MSKESCHMAAEDFGHRSLLIFSETFLLFFWGSPDYKAWDAFQPVILLPQPPVGWDFRSGLSHMLAYLRNSTFYTSSFSGQTSQCHTGSSSHPKTKHQQILSMEHKFSETQILLKTAHKTRCSHLFLTYVLPYSFKSGSWVCWFSYSLIFTLHTRYF